MKNKYFNKLSFRDRIQGYRNSARFIINQIQQPSIPQVVLFNQSNTNYLQCSKFQFSQTEMCITQSHPVAHPKQIEHTCKSCDRKSQLNSKSMNLSTTNAKLISPKIIEIILDKKKGTQFSNKNRSIHSFNQYSRVQSSERDKIKQSKNSCDSVDSRGIVRAYSSKISSKSKINKGNFSQIIKSQYSINSKEGISKSKTYNRIFRKASSANDNSLNVRGIFPVPLQNIYSRR